MFRKRVSGWETCIEVERRVTTKEEATRVPASLLCEKTGTDLNLYCLAVASATHCSKEISIYLRNREIAQLRNELFSDLNLLGIRI